MRSNAMLTITKNTMLADAQIKSQKASVAFGDLRINDWGQLKDKS